MNTLVIHTPSSKVSSSKKSFSATIRSNIGSDFAIPAGSKKLINPGWKVVILDKIKKQRSEGTLKSLKPTSKTKNGIQRYDVIINGIVSVSYKPEHLTRTGIAII